MRRILSGSDQMLKVPQIGVLVYIILYNFFIFSYYKKLKLLYNKPHFDFYINSSYSYLVISI